MEHRPRSSAQLRSFPLGSQLFPGSTASHPPGKPHQRQLRTDRQTDRQLSKTHPWLPSAPARARAPLSAGKHGQGPAGARSLAPPCPRRQEPWERKARTKMTFLLIRAIKNKVERGRSRLPTLPSSSAPAPKPSPAAGESPARACAGTAGEPSPAGSWHSGHIPHVQHFLLAFVIPERPHSRWDGTGRSPRGPVPAPGHHHPLPLLQKLGLWKVPDSNALVALENQHPEHRGLCTEGFWL